MIEINNPSQTEIHTLLEQYQNGRYDLVEQLAISITQKFPHDQFTWKVLGAALDKVGRLEESLSANQTAVALVPSDAEAHSNLGFILKKIGRLEDAKACYEKAIALKPDYAQAHSTLGNILQALGKPEDAKACYEKAIALKPDYAQAHGNLGGILKELGDLENAQLSYKKAIALKPDYAQAYSNLGLTLKELGRLEDAKACYEKAIALKPDYAEAYRDLGIILLESNNASAALDAAITSITIKPTTGVEGLFVIATKKINPHSWNVSLSEMMITALLEPWGRPADLIPFACRLLKTNPEFVQFIEQVRGTHHSDSDSLIHAISKKEFSFSPLLHAILCSGPIADAQMEKFFATLRCHLLNLATAVVAQKDAMDHIPPLYGALAQQCFINEYIYFQTTEEIARSDTLIDQIQRALAHEQAVPAIGLIAAACYCPLYSIEGAEKLLQQRWTEDIKAVLKLQIQEPLYEFNLRPSIFGLTDIENSVSLAVQSQYEEHPYPRWVRLPKETPKQFLNAYIQRKFPLANFYHLVDDQNLQLLIAGCGTGQHSIGTAQTIKGAKILAVDLSLASLAYAKRKTIEFSIDSIEYAQADLLKLASLGRTFDVIESVGVLHHLEKPFEGWQTLLSLLRPHGLMRLGFYSELARRDIVRIRNLIRQDGVGSDSQDIRNYRQHLLKLKAFEDYGYATTSSDFFSTSACRDLLFHTQEHRMNLNGIAAFLKDHDLNFLGFDIDHAAKQSYKRRFPNDLSATDLDQWSIYEKENLDTFSGMYQFWVQKNQ